MNNTLFLNFFANSEKWENLILCPAYPIGMSYYRAFRYRDNWIYESLLEKIKKGSFEYKSAIIGASFLGEERINQVLPIRKIENIHREKSWDNRYYFYFTFGEMVDFSSFENLEDLVITLPEYDQIENRADPYLLINSQANLDKIIFTDGSEKNELTSWAKYADLISHDEVLPINDKAKKSIFLRVSKIKPIEKLNDSTITGSQYGLYLQEGKREEFSILHQVPYLIDKNTDLPKLNYDFDVNSANIQLNYLHEEFSGNYQSHNVMVTGLYKSPSYSTIHVKSTQGESVEVNSDTIYLHDLKIPVRVKFNFIYRLLHQWFFVLLFLLGLLLIDLDSILNLAVPLSSTANTSIKIIGSLLTTFAFALYKDRL